MVYSPSHVVDYILKARGVLLGLLKPPYHNIIRVLQPPESLSVALL
jgi:hypothetical protein